MADSEWVKVLDPGSGAFYYWNERTFESRWDPPEGCQVKGLERAQAPELKAVLLIQNVFRAKKARQKVRMQRGAKTMKDLKASAVSATSDTSEWQELVDPVSGYPYFYNRITGEVSWETPWDETWCLAIDEETQREYYYNVKTGQAQWEKPSNFNEKATKEGMNKLDQARQEELKSKMRMALEGKLRKRNPEMVERMKRVREEQAKAMENHSRRWCEVYDPKSDAFYYYDVLTYETVWDKPHDFVMTASDELLQAALTVQSVFRMNLAKKHTLARKAQTLTAKFPKECGPWIELQDGASVFFFNRESAHVRWALPSETSIHKLSDCCVKQKEGDVNAKRDKDHRQGTTQAVAFANDFVDQLVDIATLEKAQENGNDRELHLEALAEKKETPTLESILKTERGEACEKNQEDIIAPEESETKEDFSGTGDKMTSKGMEPCEEEQVDRKPEHTTAKVSEKEKTETKSDDEPAAQAYEAGASLEPKADTGVKDEEDRDVKEQPKADEAVTATEDERKVVAKMKAEKDTDVKEQSKADEDFTATADEWKVVAKVKAEKDTDVMEQSKADEDFTATADEWKVVAKVKAEKDTDVQPKADEAVRATEDEPKAEEQVADREAKEEPQKDEKEKDEQVDTDAKPTEGVATTEDEIEANEEPKSGKDESTTDQEGNGESSTSTSISTLSSTATTEETKSTEKAENGSGAEEKAPKNRFRSNQSLRKHRMEKLAFESKRRDLEEMSSELSKVEINAELIRDRLMQGKQLLRKLESCIDKSVEKDRKKQLEGVGNSFRVSELPVKETFELVTQTKALLKSLDESKDLKPCRDVLKQASRSAVFAEAQVVVAVRSLFTSCAAVLDASAGELSKLKKQVQGSALAGSLKVNRLLTTCEVFASQTSLRIKYVDTFSHKRFVNEGTQSMRYKTLCKRLAAEDKELEMMQKLELIEEQESKVYERVFSELECVLAAEIGALEDMDVFTTVLRQFVDEHLELCLWWPSYNSAIVSCLKVKEDVLGASKTVRETLETAQQQREARQMMAEEALQRAECAAEAGLSFERACREQFLRMCRDRWAEGLRQRGDSRSKFTKAANKQTKGERVGKGQKDTLSQRLVQKECFRSPWEAISKNCSLDAFEASVEDLRKRYEFQESRIFDIDQPDKETGRILLHVACWYNRLDLVKFLIHAGANPNASRGRVDPTTPLHVATRAKASGIVSFLVQSGALVTLQDSAGDTPFHWACRMESVSCVRALLQESNQQQQEAVDSREEGQFFSKYAALTWKALGKQNLKGRVPTELLPRTRSKSCQGIQELSYSGKRIYGLLRDLEIAAQQKLLRNELE